jgi:hypothetical protein
MNSQFKCRGSPRSYEWFCLCKVWYCNANPHFPYKQCYNWDDQNLTKNCKLQILLYKNRNIYISVWNILQYNYWKAYCATKHKNTNCRNCKSDTKSYRKWTPEQSMEQTDWATLCSFVSNFVRTYLFLFGKNLEWTTSRSSRGYKLHYKSSYVWSFVTRIFAKRGLSVPLKEAYFHSMHVHIKCEASISFYLVLHSALILCSFYGWIT